MDISIQHACVFSCEVILHLVTGFARFGAPCLADSNIRVAGIRKPRMGNSAVIEVRDDQCVRACVRELGGCTSGA